MASYNYYKLNNFSILKRCQILPIINKKLNNDLQVSSLIQLVYRDTHKSIDNKYQQQVNLDSIIPDPIHIREKQKNSRRDAQLRRSSNSSAVKKIEYVPSFGDKKSKLNETELKRNEVTYASLKKFRDQSTKIEKQLTSLTKQQLNSIKKTDSKTEKTQKGDNSVYNTLGTYGENLKKNKDIMNHFQFLSSIEHKVKIKN